MTTKAISDLSNELRRIRRRLGGFDYASVEDRIAEELLSSGYIRQAAPGGGDALLARCQEFLLNDNKKSRTVVIAAQEFANFISGEIALDRQQRLSALPQEAPAQPQAAREVPPLAHLLKEVDPGLADILTDNAAYVRVIRGNVIKECIAVAASHSPSDYTADGMRSGIVDALRALALSPTNPPVEVVARAERGTP